MKNETNISHTPADFILDEFDLRPEAVSVLVRRSGPGTYDVEIHSADRDYTFESEVAEAFAKSIGGKVLTHSSGNGISVCAPRGFRAPRGFVRIDSL